MGNVLVKTCGLAVKEGWERAKKKEVKKQNQRKADRDRGFKSFFYYYSFYVKRHSASNGADRNPIGHVVLEVNMVIVYI